MAEKIFSIDELNFFKCSSIVHDKIPNALRQTFKTMWNSRIAMLPGYQPWDDSVTVRNLLLKNEGGKYGIPTNRSIDEWDSTALFRVILNSRTFAVSDGKGPKKTLAEVYLKRRIPKPNPFHPTVISPSGDNDETLTLAIDQLRLLRITHVHSARGRISKADYDGFVLLTKDAFKALNVPTDSVDAIGSLSESHFLSAKDNELNEINQFLQEEVVNDTSDVKETVKKLKQAEVESTHRFECIPNSSPVEVMASLADHEKTNGARLIQLFVDKGTEAMRNLLDSIHPPTTLTVTLLCHRGFLQKLCNHRIIKRSQMDILFPPSGAAPQSKDFDITLLFFLLRNICGLHPPASTGSWDINPPTTDTTREADVVRIKYYRNKLFSHITTTRIDDATFNSYWNDISAAVVRLGVSEGEVKKLQCSRLEENLYISPMKEWKQKVDRLEVMLKEHQNEASTKLETVAKDQKRVLQNREVMFQAVQERSRKTHDKDLSRTYRHKVIVKC